MSLYAAKSGNVDSLKTALAGGADPNCKDVEDDKSRQILAVAASRGHTEVVRELIKAGANVHATSDLREWSGWTYELWYGSCTALHEAARKGRTECAIALLEAGASKEVRNQQRQTPYDLARAEGHRKTADAIRAFDPVAHQKKQAEEVARQQHDAKMREERAHRQLAEKERQLEAQAQEIAKLRAMAAESSHSEATKRAAFDEAADPVEAEKAAAVPSMAISVHVDHGGQTTSAHGPEIPWSSEHQTVVQSVVASHDAAVRSAELSSIEGGDWFADLSGKVRFVAGGQGRIDLSTVLAPDMLEGSVLGGKAKIVPAGIGNRRPGPAVSFAPGTLPSEASMSSIEAGRIPPLNLPGGKGGVGQGVNGFVFAVELQPREKSKPPAQVALKGLLPVVSASQYYSSVLRAGHQEEWRVPRVVGAHPNIVAVRHSFFGSSMALVPWAGDFLMFGAVARRTTWLVMPLYPTSLQSSTKKVPCSGQREAALWLLQALQATQHMFRRGAVHRDIKADNFFLAGDGRLVLGDFGAGCLLFYGGRADALELEYQEHQREQALDHAAATGAGSVAFDEAGRTESGGAEEAVSESASDGTAAEAEEQALPEVFEGAGEDALEFPFMVSVTNSGGAWDCRAPELVAMGQRTRPLKKDSHGRPLRTLSQAYEMADAWAAAKTVWMLLASSDSAQTFPSSAKLYRSEELPALPSAGRQLEAILRGLLQSRPSNRLRPEDAISALKAFLYGPGTLKGVERAAAPVSSVHTGVLLAQHASVPAASGAGADSSVGGAPDTAWMVEEVEAQLQLCAALDGPAGTHRDGASKSIWWGLAGQARFLRLPIGEDAYDAFGWGAARCVDGESSLWDRQMRRQTLLRGACPAESAAALSKDCKQLLDVIRRYALGDS